jgi:hypothetical protein
VCKPAGAESDHEGGRRPKSTLAFCLQSSGAAAAAEERRRLADDNAALREAAVAAEGRELAAAGEAAELRRRLADALRCAEAERRCRAGALLGTQTTRYLSTMLTHRDVNCAFACRARCCAR